MNNTSKIGSGKGALVTGAYGFVGRHVAKTLASNGWTVAGIGHGSWSREEWRDWGISEWHNTDVTAESLGVYANNPDAIIHCAGSGSVAYSMTHPYQDFQRSVGTLLSVLEYARQSGTKPKIVYPSSAAVYGDIDKLPIFEDANKSPISPYGVHKYIGEQLCQSYSKNYDIPISAVRLFSVYGNGLRKQLLWDASRKIELNESSYFGTGNEVRDWIHISDAVSLLIASIDIASNDCVTINGGTGTGVNVRDILVKLYEEMGSDLTPSFTGSTRHGDPVGYVADMTRAASLGWAPKVKWQEGVKSYARWIKNGAI